MELKSIRDDRKWLSWPRSRLSRLPWPITLTQNWVLLTLRWIILEVRCFFHPETCYLARTWDVSNWSRNPQVSYIDLEVGYLDPEVFFFLFFYSDVSDLNLEVGYLGQLTRSRLTWSGSRLPMWVTSLGPWRGLPLTSTLQFEVMCLLTKSKSGVIEGPYTYEDSYGNLNFGHQICHIPSWILESYIIYYLLFN